MSIINEQNILGNPALATATRPGSDVTIADYSFGTMSGLYEKVVHEAMGLARGGDWTQPTSYAGEVFQAEVEKEPSSHPAGPAGDPTQDSPTQYGVTGDGPLTENAEMQTKNSQAARIIAGEAEAANFVDSTSSAVRSDLNKDEGVQGPASSGGQFNGYEATNQYWSNPNAFDGRGDTTPPAPIEDTGLKPLVVPGLQQSAAPNNDDPEGTGKTKKTGKKKKTNKSKTTGASAKKNSTPDPGSQADYYSTSSSYKVHKEKTNANTGIAGGRPLDAGMESGGANPTAQEGLDMGAKYF